MKFYGTKWYLSLFILSSIFVPAYPVDAAEPDIAEHPDLISALHHATPQSFCGEAVPMGSEEVKERFEKEFLLSLYDRPQVILWLKRSRRYFPYIEKMLKENGLPDDLKYLAVAESALRPHAGSRRGAIGFWQFMQHTGRKYGLKIDRRIDERRNLFASTQAAIRYLKKLHEEFGSWTLAAAAYNMGEAGLMAEILEQETEDYYKLYLPLETQRFLFRILSIKLILEHPKKYGFNLTDADYYPPFKFDRVKIESKKDLPIRTVARAANTTFKVIKDLNPEIRGHYIPSGSRYILMPEGASKGFHKRLTLLLKAPSSTRNEIIYVIKRGDNLSAIADRFDVPLTSLLIWNGINPKHPIHPGDRLLIYPRNR
ncbi:MAG: transglycosylase SLT domain-containing protein [Deltaproteobacteria bacterium]|nr:transglycosylase SLT domain-containing protein [Deltaproteobacteria bacterium]